MTKSLSVAYMTLKMYLTCTFSCYLQFPFSLKTCISFLQSSVYYCMLRANPKLFLMTYFPQYPLLSISNKSLGTVFVIFRVFGHVKFFTKFTKSHEIFKQCERCASTRTNLFIIGLFISSHRIILEIGSISTFTN